MVALSHIVRSACAVMRTRTPPTARQARRAALAPFPLSMLFLFRGGVLFEIEWAENGAKVKFSLKLQESPYFTTYYGDHRQRT